MKLGRQKAVFITGAIIVGVACTVMWSIAAPTATEYDVLMSVLSVGVAITIIGGLLLFIGFGKSPNDKNTP